MKKKRRLKRWVKETLWTLLAIAILSVLLFSYVKRVEWFNHNIEQCGSNYCD